MNSVDAGAVARDKHPHLDPPLPYFSFVFGFKGLHEHAARKGIQYTESTVQWFYISDRNFVP